MAATAVTSVVDAITGVFSSIGTWIATSINDLLPMFYSSETGLTFLGVLAVMSLGFSVIFLMISVIQNFLHFRG